MPTAHFSDAPGEVLAHIGGGAADVDPDHIGVAIDPGKRLDAFDTAARARAVGLDRDRLGHAGGVAVIAEDQQRVLRAVLTQPVFRVIQKRFHARVEEGVDQCRPGAAHRVLVDAEVTAVQRRYGAQQVPRVLAQRHLAEGAFHRNEIGATKADNNAARARSGQFVDGPDDLHLRVVAHHQGGIEQHHPVTDQSRIDIRVVCGQLFQQARSLGVDDQAQPGALAFADRVGALRGRVADQIHLFQQATHIRFAIDDAGGFFQPFEEAFAEVVRRRQHLGLLDPLTIDDADVGQRSAVVDVDL